MDRILFILAIFICISCKKEDNKPNDLPTNILQVQSVKIGTKILKVEGNNSGIPIDKDIVANFNQPLERTSVNSRLVLKEETGQIVNLSLNFLEEDRTTSAQPEVPLKNNTNYIIEIGSLKAVNGEEFPGVTYTFTTVAGVFILEDISIEDQSLQTSTRAFGINRDFEILARFSAPLSPSTNFDEYFSLQGKSGAVKLAYGLSEDRKTITVKPESQADALVKLTLTISSELESEEGYSYRGFSKAFYTAVDSTYKFPEIPDEDLLTLIQEQTFKYFWDFAHPESGMARERNSSGNLVTVGGSGFGVMTILTGIERGFITRQEGLDRLEKIVNFLKNGDRFHGVWPHWMDGNTGNVIPFSSKDNGGDLVETAFMIQGLLTVRQYLDETNTQEATIIENITQLWEEVEWDWYTKGGENTLYWHWSPNFGWEMNHQISGWNESLIVYVLAASSPTHPITADVYHQGWANNGGMANGRAFYSIDLPLGEDYGGPLFFSHYSFLGLDPRNLEDQYANYWEQNVSHSLINQQHAVANPNHFVGYGAASWGFTASDNHQGYSAHSPLNDLGVITPTAAISSIPYTPEESMAAIKHFYYVLGDRLWGNYGFYDAFNPTEEWVANSFLAIDQGPIIIMIENYRTALLWDLFMGDPEVIEGLEKLGFTSF
ncbi:MAG: Ig-like domain-containing protein [Bacteroidota bacterium]|nr:Ig-like domain-containing protein [Bacteroidota bacterium]